MYLESKDINTDLNAAQVVNKFKEYEAKKIEIENQRIESILTNRKSNPKLAKFLGKELDVLDINDELRIEGGNEKEVSEHVKKDSLKFIDNSEAQIHNTITSTNNSESNINNPNQSNIPDSINFDSITNLKPMFSKTIETLYDKKIHIIL